MATVTLETVWLNLASDPSDFVKLPTMTSFAVETTQPGEVRVLANGRRRIIRRASKGRAATLSTKASTRAVVEWIEAHVGDLVCVRDDRGRKFFGTYLASGVDEVAVDIDSGDITLSLAEVTFSEAV